MRLSQKGRRFATFLACQAVALIPVRLGPKAGRSTRGVMSSRAYHALDGCFVRANNQSPSAASHGIEMPVFIRCQMPTFRRVTRWPAPNMIARTMIEPTKMNVRNIFIPLVSGTFRSACSAKTGTRGPSKPRPKPPWRLFGIGNMPPITIDIPQSASAMPAAIAQVDRPLKSRSANARPNAPSNAATPPIMIGMLNSAGCGASAAPS